MSPPRICSGLENGSILERLELIKCTISKGSKGRISISALYQLLGSFSILLEISISIRHEDSVLEIYYFCIQVGYNIG